MLHREIIAVSSEIHIKHINTLRGQNAELVNVKPGGTYNNHWAFKTSELFMKSQSVPRPHTTSEL